MREGYTAMNRRPKATSTPTRRRGRTGTKLAANVEEELWVAAWLNCLALLAAMSPLLALVDSACDRADVLAGRPDPEVAVVRTIAEVYRELQQHDYGRLETLLCSLPALTRETTTVQ